MTTHTMPSTMRAAKQHPSTRPAPSTVATHTSWSERLAAWAERQPNHRRLGCWTAS